MDDKKITSSEAIRLRRTKVLGPFALASAYPSPYSSDAAHVKRIEIEPPERGVRRRLAPNLPAEDGAAKPWKKPWDK
jgi:hypothetical protein